MVDKISEDIPTPFSPVFQIPIVNVVLVPAAAAVVSLKDIFYRPSLNAAPAKDQVPDGSRQ
jgi:hypothetical protein